MTPAQRARKVNEARLLMRRARGLLDAVHGDYAGCLGIDLTEQDRVAWREVVDLLTPVDRLADAGRLDHR